MLTLDERGGEESGGEVCPEGVRGRPQSAGMLSAGSAEPVSGRQAGASLSPGAQTLAFEATRAVSGPENEGGRRPSGKCPLKEVNEMRGTTSLIAFVVLLPAVSSAAQTGAQCEAAEYKAAAAEAKGELACYATAAKKSILVDTTCSHGSPTEIHGDLREDHSQGRMLQGSA